MINTPTQHKTRKSCRNYFKELPPHHVNAIDATVCSTEDRILFHLEDVPKHGPDRRYNLLPEDRQNATVDCFILSRRINDLRYVNKFFEAMNRALPEGGHFVGMVETSGQRRERQMAKFIWPINVIYCFIDYLVWRVWPKIPRANKIYFHFTKGRNRVLSKIETFGRLYSCGYTVEKDFSHNGRLYFIARKRKEPDFNTDPTYGPLIRLHRVGKGGKNLVVYKLRTMYPYSEYLQEYLYEKNGLQEGGKFKDDPRVNKVGLLFRKYWLDEIPMFYHLLRGDCKLVGVRPISWHYFSLYPLEFQEFRKQFKPGLIPPVYVEIPKTLEDVIEVEKRYLEAYQKQPFLTDMYYLYGLFYNVIFRKIRSN